MSCYSDKFEFYKGEAKRLEIQVNTYNSKTDCREPIGLVGPLASASLVLQDLTFTSLLKLGDTGNKIQIEYVSGGTAGLEAVSFSGSPIHIGGGLHVPSKITVKLQAGISTAVQVKSALEANENAMKMISIVVSGFGGAGQIAVAPTALTGGSGTAVEVELQTENTDNIILDMGTDPVIVVDNGPLSKISVDLTNDQTSIMITGPIVVRVTKEGKMRTAVSQGGVYQLNPVGC